MVPRGEGKAMDCGALGLGRGVSQQNGLLFNSCAMGSLNSPPIDVYYRNDLRVDGRLGSRTTAYHARIPNARGQSIEVRGRGSRSGPTLCLRPEGPIASGDHPQNRPSGP